MNSIIALSTDLYPSKPPATEAVACHPVNPISTEIHEDVASGPISMFTPTMPTPPPAYLVVSVYLPVFSSSVLTWSESRSFILPHVLSGGILEYLPFGWFLHSLGHGMGSLEDSGGTLGHRNYIEMEIVNTYQAKQQRFYSYINISRTLPVSLLVIECVVTYNNNAIHSFLLNFFFVFSCLTKINEVTLMLSEDEL